MKHLKLNDPIKLTILGILILVLGLATPARATEASERIKECINLSGEGKIGATTPETQQKLLSAYQLLGTTSSRKDGIKLLQVAANEGSSEANYRLGSLYVEGAFPETDLGDALQYLKKVNGERKTAASILIGVVHARGSKSFKPDLIVTRTLFNKAAMDLKALSKACEAAPGSLDRNQTIISTKALMRSVEDWNILTYYAKEYGIEIK